MKKFLITLIFITSLWLAAFWWSYYNEISFTKTLFSENFPSNKKLSENYFFAKSNRGLSSLELGSNCIIKSKYIGQQAWIDIFSFSILEEDCTDFKIYLTENNNKIISTINRIKLNPKWEILKFYTDFSDKDLDLQISSFTSKLNNLEKKEEPKNGFLKLKQAQEIEKNKYYIELLNLIKSARKEKYLIPTPGYSMPTLPVRFPNAGRWYRAAYTDGIHHGWDFYAPLRSNVVSLDDGVVIRVVKNFQFKDLEAVNYSNNLTKNQKAINLDILRWNQVWIKTMKWDVALYSHLSVIYDDIEEWKFIPKNYPVGKIWITWVPDANYKNYHLHLPIQKNPYNKEKYWKYSYLDIMKWDWIFKWKTLNYIAKNQYNIFTK